MPCEAADITASPIREEVAQDVQDLLTSYFQWRGDSFGVVMGHPRQNDAILPYLSDAVLAAENQRVTALDRMRAGWGCLYSGADSTFRVDKIIKNPESILLYVYEFAYFNSWYKKYSSPETADRSGYGVKHVLLLRRHDGGWTLDRDDYYEGRPTYASSDAYQENPAYIQYAGRPSNEGRAVTGQPPALESANPDFMEEFSPEEVIRYADIWAPGRNREAYGDYSMVGGDCCNFASQCLLSGGLPMDEAWYSRDGKGSLVWISSTRLYRYLSQTQKVGKGVAVLRQKDEAGRTIQWGKKTYKASQILIPGSPVFYKWGGGFAGDERWSHTAICVGVLGDGTPAVSCHTGDKYHIKWNYGGENCDYGTVQLSSR